MNVRQNTCGANYPKVPFFFLLPSVQPFFISNVPQQFIMMSWERLHNKAQQTRMCILKLWKTGTHVWPGAAMHELSPKNTLPFPNKGNNMWIRHYADVSQKSIGKSGFIYIATLSVPSHFLPKKNRKCNAKNKPFIPSQQVNFTQISLILESFPGIILTCFTWWNSLYCCNSNGKNTMCWLHIV